MNKTPVFLILIGIVLAGSYLLLTKTSNPVINIAPEEDSIVTNVSSKVDYSAGFAIFTNGTFRVFSASMYHNLSNDVYIQADNPNIIHVRKSNTTWNDFFSTLPLKLSKECLTTGTKQVFCTDAYSKLKFYINGIEDVNALDKNIENGDKLLVSYGNENESQIIKQFQQIPDIK